jgi:2-polyprenyl-3-methyl-5-hydroxy-6-metoxy-1,4-benzoquinol methylase
MDETFHYGDDVEAHWSPEDPKEVATRHIPTGARVLDVGCGAGALGAWLKKNKDCKVTGIEGHPKGAAIARKQLDQVHEVDLNDLDALQKALGKSQYDVICFMDVLEHCYHPDKLLELMKHHLAPTGRVIVSLPNVAHHSVRFGLLGGKFDYADTGILDKTHVRLYTRSSSLKLVEDAGYIVESVENTSPTVGLWHYVSKVDPTLSAVQFVVIAHL